MSHTSADPSLSARVSRRVGPSLTGRRASPARKAHPAFLVDDIDATAARVTEAGFPVTWDDDFPGHRRFYTADGNGNRVEILS
jgi:catechol 2,3-dioxygenase-like lactoylglutathione lyase family enzyme